MAQGSIHGLEAFWIGGASGPSGIRGGTRGLMAFWMGGASGLTTTPPPPPPPPPPPEPVHHGAGGIDRRLWEAHRIRRLVRDEEELLILLALEGK